jgi:hypothetical protein
MKTRTILICISLLIVSTVLFAQTPEWEWAASAGGSNYDFGKGIVVDAAGNSYVAGFFKSTATFGSFSLTSSGQEDIFVAKMDANGNWLWASKAGGYSYDRGNEITIDDAGNIYVTGIFFATATFGSHSLTSGGVADIFVAKMDSNGNWLWATRAGGTSGIWANAIALDDAGNCYVTGSFDGTAIFGSYSITESSGPIFVAKININGVWLWANQAGGYFDYDIGQGIAVDDYGNCYTTGFFEDAATFGSQTIYGSGYRDIYVAKINTNGYWQWATQAGGNGDNVGWSITLDNAGNSYVTGWFENTAVFGNYSISSNGYTDIYVAKINTNGYWQWVRRAGGNISDQGFAISSDDAGNCYLTGDFSGTATFGYYSITANSSPDIFVASINSGGNWLSASQAGGSYADEGWAITIDSEGNNYVAGRFESTASFGLNYLTSNGDYDIFVAKLNNNITYDITFNSLADMITARSGFAYANDRDYLYAIAGANYDLPNDRINNIEKYDPATNNWSEFADGLIPRLYCRAEYIQSTDNIYIFGGLAGNSSTHTDTMEVVDVNTGNITYLIADHILSSQSGSAVWNNKIFIFGGNLDNGYSNDLYEFDPSGNNWTQLANMPESKETEGEIVDGILYVFGGYNGSVSNRIDAYNIQNDEWSFIGYMPTGVSAHHTTASGQYIWLLGSYSDLNFAAEFNTATHEFTQLSNNMIGRRHCGTEVIGDNLYVYGGYIPGNDLSSLQYAEISNVDIDDEPNIIPSPLTLFQNYPNPFYPKTTISFSIKQNSEIELEIFNIKGQRVKTLINEFMQTGDHSTIWNGDDEYGKHVCSGLYFYKLSTNGKTEVIKKCLLVK